MREWEITYSAGRMAKLGRMVDAVRIVLRPYLDTRPAVIYHVFCLTFGNKNKRLGKTDFFPASCWPLFLFDEELGEVFSVGAVDPLFHDPALEVHVLSVVEGRPPLAGL